jgi:hypothetical protein
MLGVGGWYLEGDADDGLFIGYAGPSAGWLFYHGFDRQHGPG